MIATQEGAPRLESPGQLRLDDFSLFAGQLIGAQSAVQALQVTSLFILDKFPAQMCFIGLFDDQGSIHQRFLQTQASSPLDETAHQALKSICQQLSRGRSPLVLANRLMLQNHSTGLEKLEHQALVGLPLQFRTVSLYGALLLLFDQPYTLSPVELEGLQLCAGQFCAIYAHFYQMEQNRQRLADLESVIDTAHILTSTLNIPDLLHQISVRLAWITSVEACCILSYDPASQRLNVLASFDQLGLPAGLPLSDSLFLPDYPAMAEMLSNQASASSHLIIEPDQAESTLSEHKLVKQTKFSSCLIQPLLAIGEPLGLLLLFSRQSNGESGGSAFPPTTLRRLRLLSEQVALALINARVFQSEYRQRTLAEALRSISLALSSSLKANAILDILLDQIKSVIPYDTALVLLVEGGEAVTATFRGFEQFELAQTIKDYRLPLNQSELLQTMSTNGQPLVIPDLAVVAGWQPDALAVCAGSWLGAPLVARERVLGFLVLNTCQPGFYTPEHAHRLEMLTSHVALALVNANIYDEASRAATIDFLTGAFNHRHFQQALRQEIDRTRRFEQPLSLLMVDLDFFKKVNDTYGHPVGDQILRQMAARFKNELRSSDLLARYGGEEFAVLLPNTPPNTLAGLSERLLNAIRKQPFHVEERQISMTISIGGASFPLHASDAPDLLSAADKALYRSKQFGRDRFSLAESPGQTSE